MLRIFKGSDTFCDTEYSQHEANFEAPIEYDYIDENTGNIIKSKKIIQSIDPAMSAPFVLHSRYMGGRLGNFLFLLSDLVIVHSEYIKVFGMCDMYTNWTKMYFEDYQSRTSNIFNYPAGLKVFENIKCEHFSENLFSTKYATKIESFVLKDIDTQKNYGTLELWNCSEGKVILYIIERLIIGHNYFLFDNIVEKTDEIIGLLGDAKCKKFVVISQQKTYPKYKAETTFNFRNIEHKKDLLKDKLFGDYDSYIANLNKTKLFSGKDTIKVCMHLRGGDYSICENLHFPIMYYTYYLQCLNDIIRQNPEKKIIVVFSFKHDDKKIGLFYKRKIMENINSDIKIYFEDDDIISDSVVNIGCNDNHLYFMSSFDYYIMSNSTYSFWSAYLSDKTIYFPGCYQMLPDIEIGKESELTIGNCKFTLSDYDKQLRANSYIMSCRDSQDPIDLCHYSNSLFGNSRRHKITKIEKILSPLYFLLGRDNISIFDKELTTHYIYFICSKVSARNASMYFEGCMKKRKNINFLTDMFLVELAFSGKQGTYKLINKHNKYLEQRKEFVEHDRNQFDEISEYFVDATTTVKHT